MVVITVISILATIGLQVIGGLISQARHSATVATIEKIQGLLNQRAQALDKLRQRHWFESSAESLFATRAGFTGDTHRVVTQKLLVAHYFPQYVEEMSDPLIPLVLNGSTVPGVFLSRGMNASYPNLINPSGVPIGNPSNPEILYDFLTQEGMIGNSPVALDAFSAQEVQDIDNNGFPEFIDAWGHPLRFYRWPTRLFRPAGIGGQIDVVTAQQLFATLPVFTGNLQSDLARDADDPLGDCASIPGGFEGRTIAGTSVLGSTPSTYHVFLVVSAGPDGVFGMGSPSDTSTFGYLGIVQDITALQDDIIYLSIRAGGK